MIKKMVSPAILTGANGILNSVSGNVETNMSEAQIQELIKTQLSENPQWTITSMAAEEQETLSIVILIPVSLYM